MVTRSYVSAANPDLKDLIIAGEAVTDTECCAASVAAGDALSAACPPTFEYTCDDGKDFRENGPEYTQIRLTLSLTAGTTVYGTVNYNDAVAYCKDRCTTRVNNGQDCVGFFYQKHSNGNEVCGFYQANQDLGTAIDTSNELWGAVCMRKFQKDQQVLPWTPEQSKRVSYCAAQDPRPTVDLCSIANEYGITCPSTQHTVCVSIQYTNVTVSDATIANTKFTSIGPQMTFTHFNTTDLSKTKVAATHGVVDILDPTYVGEHYLAFSTSTSHNCAGDGAMVGVVPQWRVDIDWTSTCTDFNDACAAAEPVFKDLSDVPREMLLGGTSSTIPFEV